MLRNLAPDNLANLDTVLSNYFLLLHLSLRYRCVHTYMYAGKQSCLDSKIVSLDFQRKKIQDSHIFFTLTTYCLLFLPMFTFCSFSKCQEKLHVLLIRLSCQVSLCLFSNVVGRVGLTGYESLKFPY